MSRPTKEEPQKLFAFWKYDGFPYMLGAEVVRFTENGRVVAKGFEGYATFEPIAIIPLDRGLELKAKLEKLRAEQRKAEEAFRAEWKKKSAALLAEARTTPKKRR